MSVKAPEQLSLQENVLATAMLHRIGDATVRYALLENGTRQHELPELVSDEIAVLEQKFAVDPKDSLAWARESLFAIGHDDRLSKEQKDSRLNRYLDAYFDLTVKLDRATFPTTPEGKVTHSIPDYIPDGLVDMGGERSITGKRFREMIVVDKRAVLDRYKPILHGIFSHDFGEMPLQRKKQIIAQRLLLEVAREMPYQNKFHGFGDVKLSTLTEGVCRHRALVYEVLSQAAGLKSKLLKADMDGMRHSTNMTRVDGQWFIADVNNPDFKEIDGIKVWRPGMYPVDEPPPKQGDKKYVVKARYSGVETEYRAHNDMYWYIKKPEA